MEARRRTAGATAMTLLGVALVLTLTACKIGNLDGVCGAGQTCVCDGIGNCRYSCPGGNCKFRCSGIGNCDITCEGGGCTLDCQGTGNCILSCPDRSCQQTCKVQGNCILKPCTKCVPDARLLDVGRRDVGGLRDGKRVDGARWDGPRTAEARASDGGTSCGTSSCDPALQICVEKSPIGPSTQVACQTVPKGCEGQALRTCACVGKALCVAPFDTCSDGKSANTIHCECVACQ